MPEEVLAILIVVSLLTFVATVIRSTQQYKLKKLERLNRDDSSESLTVSELHKLIDQSVNEATSSIQDQLSSLEGRLSNLESSGVEGLGLEAETDPERPEKTMGRALRQR
jgi:hypothetical protein